MPKIEPGYRANFDTLCRALANGDAALVDCRDRATKKPVRVICALQRDDQDQTTLIPLAKLFDGNPYDELDPPDSNAPDGYVDVAEASQDKPQ